MRPPARHSRNVRAARPHRRSPDRRARRAGRGRHAIDPRRSCAAMAGVNHELVRLIGSHGAKAIGIDGHDGGLLVASADSDRVGTSAVARFDGTALNAFLENGLVPVVMPVAPDDAGRSPAARGTARQPLRAAHGRRHAGDDGRRHAAARTWRTRGAVRHHGTRALARRAPAAAAAACVRDALDALAHGVQNVHLADIGQPNR